MSMEKQRRYTLLCLDRLKAVVEHANLSHRELMSLTAEVNEIYARHIMPEQPREDTKPQ